MSGGIRTSLKGYTKVKRGDLAMDTTHENTERDNASETTFINSQSSNAPQLAAAADCIDKKPANEDSPSNPPRDGLNSNVRVSSVSVPSTRQIEGEILQPFNLKSFRIDELKKATRNFRIDATLNAARMRRVFKGWIDENSLTATVPGTGMAIAVSFVLFKHEMPLQSRNEWLTEVNRVRQLHNQNLVRLIGYCLEDDCRLLVYEFMAKGRLDNHLFRRGYFEPLSWNVRMKIALGSAKGLAFLHGDDANILYRDFKACNILLDSAYNAKLYNFCVSKDGSASYGNHVSTDVMATHGYAAPEYIATGDCTAKCDVYSFGVVLLEMLTGRRAVDKNQPSEEQNLVEWARRYLASKRKVVLIFDDRLEGQYSAGVALGAANLASQCLSIEPRCRPNMDEVVKALEKLQG
ncbi:unnamed protein product [Malus baccata var. baccata]